MSRFVIRFSLFVCILTGCGSTIDNRPSVDAGSDSTIGRLGTPDAGDNRPSSVVDAGTSMSFNDVMFAVCGNYNFNVWCGTNHSGTSLEFTCKAVQDAAMTANPRLILSASVSFPCENVVCVYECS